MAGLGEIPARASMRGYWKLENVNDSSGNGRTLTNFGSVPFVAGKFSNSADFGTSGTTKRLTLGSNLMSALEFPDATISLWVKFNDSATANVGAGIFDLVTRLASGSGAARTRLSYSISGGNFVITAITFLTTTDVSRSYTTSANTTNWYNIVVVKSSTVNLSLYVNGVLISSGSGVGADENNILSGAFLYIGNGGAAGANGTRQGFVKIDEFIVEERVWSSSEIRKYYSQAKGMFAPQ